MEKKVYSLDEGIKLLKEKARAKFDEGVEIHLKLGIDPKKDSVKGIVILPHTVGKKNIIAAFVTPLKFREAKEAGADVIGGEELIQKIKEEEKINFDVAIAEPAMMDKLIQIAKILGPRGLMPNPKAGTVTQNIKKTIEEFRKGRVNFKNDEGGNIHALVGKVSWDAEKIKENVEAFIEAVKKAKPAGAKGVFIKNATICSTMGPGIKIQI